MNFNIYLPEELGQRVRSEDLNLSRMLRDAVTAEFKRRDAMAEALSDSQTYEFEWKDQDGEYTARITGRQVWPDGKVGQQDHAAIYVASGNRVLVVYPSEQDHRDITPDEDLMDALRDAYVLDLVEPDEFREVCRRLGVKPVIDL